MLGTHLAKGTYAGALEHGPKRLHAVGVGLALDAENSGRGLDSLSPAGRPEKPAGENPVRTSRSSEAVEGTLGCAARADEQSVNAGVEAVLHLPHLPAHIPDLLTHVLA